MTKKGAAVNDGRVRCGPPMARDSYETANGSALMGVFLFRHGARIEGSDSSGPPLRFCVGSRQWVDCPNGLMDAQQVLRQQLKAMDDDGMMFRDLDEDWGVIANADGEITHRALTRDIREVHYLGQFDGPLQNRPLTIDEAGIGPATRAPRHRG